MTVVRFNNNNINFIIANIDIPINIIKNMTIVKVIALGQLEA